MNVHGSIIQNSGNKPIAMNWWTGYVKYGISTQRILFNVKRNEELIYTAWMIFENIMLSETASQKDHIFHLYEIYRIGGSTETESRSADA